MGMRWHVQIRRLLLAGGAALCLMPFGVAQAADRVVVAINDMTGNNLGRLILTDLPTGGVRLDPLVQGLPPGDHALVVASTGSCRIQAEQPDLFHPLMSGVYDEMDEQGRLQVTDDAAEAALHDRQEAFLERIAAREAVDANQAPVPRAPRYTATDTELALGNLPDLVVDQYGNATRVSFAPKITVAQLYGRSIHIRAQDTNQPGEPLGCAAISFPSRP